MARPAVSILRVGVWDGVGGPFFSVQGSAAAHGRGKNRRGGLHPGRSAPKTKKTRSPVVAGERAVVRA